MGEMESLIIPDSFNYEKIQALSNEARQKFIKIRPHTLGQASRISGVNPSDVQILMVYMGPCPVKIKYTQPKEMREITWTNKFSIQS